jgi:hypothetical protein
LESLATKDVEQAFQPAHLHQGVSREKAQEAQIKIILPLIILPKN